MSHLTQVSPTVSYAVRRGGVISKGIVAATGHKLYKTVLNHRSHKRVRKSITAIKYYYAISSVPIRKIQLARIFEHKLFWKYNIYIDTETIAPCI